MRNDYDEFDNSESRKVKRRGIMNTHATENLIEFLSYMHETGLPLTTEQEEVLEDAGIIQREETKEKHSKELYPQDVNKSSGKKGELKRSKKYVKIGKYINDGNDITADDWKPESKMNHSPEFIKFIDTMIRDGFQNKSHYEPLDLYIQQAHNWMTDEDSYDHYHTQEEKLQYVIKEFNRIKENSLYFLDKYVKIKGGDMHDVSSNNYVAKPVHEVLAFLYDCGYSMIVGKPRQIAATTTFMALAQKTLMTSKDSFLKFITMDVDSAEEIIEDKLKFPVSKLPEFLQPSIHGDSATTLKFMRKEKGKKGSRGGANSKIHLVAPSISAINGGAPDKVFVDEAAYIRMLRKMIKEARPTMFKENPVTHEIEMVRQMIIWGTGGTDDSEKPKFREYEKEFMDIMEQWNKRSFSSGIVPVFFDWTTRPGITQEFYENEKKVYTSEGPDKEELMIQFKLTYPTRLEDMFLTSAKTLFPITYIEKQDDRIREAVKKYPLAYGYFEPILDLNKPSTEHDDIPYAVKGAEFVPTSFDDPRRSVTIFMRPTPKWRDRYYQGTDPIMQDNGYSNMASAVFDAEYNTLVATVDYRDPDHKYTFLQCMLLGLYYDTENRGGIPELVESNIGTAYCNYQEYKGFGRRLVHNKELPSRLRGGSSKLGVDNRGNRNKYIINSIADLIHNFGDRIYHPELFKQLRTFICTFSKSGNETWGTQDARHFHDDVLFAGAFAYICRQCNEFRDPVCFKDESTRFVQRYKLVRDDNGHLSRQQVNKRIF